jgi:phage terminase large subunit-like protein
MAVCPVTKYATAVINGKEPACEYVKEASRRHLSDLKWRDVYFDRAAVDKVLTFARLLPHVQGELRGERFKPAPAQIFILGSIFGWKKKSTGLRRYRYFYVELPRKNAKSFLCSVIALYCLLLDGEGGAEVYSVATKLDQAKKVWDVSKMMVKSTPGLAGHIRAFHNSLVVDSTDSKYQPLASDSNTLDGLNPHAVIADELHAWPSRDLWDVIEDGMGGRSQPLLGAITTAGFNKIGICFELRNHGLAILKNGSKFDDTFFIYIATIDAGDDWRDPKSWRKSNPMLGTAKSLEYMKDQCQKAQLMPGKENSFKNKQLDEWTTVADRWLDVERWEKLKDDRTLEDLRGLKCIAGMDLASTVDLTAIVYLFQESDGFFVWPVFFLPEETVEARKSRAPYQLWTDQGWIETTPGGAVDQEAMREHLLHMNNIVDIEEIALEPWNSAGLSPKLIDDGFEVVNIRQGFVSLSAPTKELEKLVVKKEIKHNGNPVISSQSFYRTIPTRVGKTYGKQNH